MHICSHCGKKFRSSAKFDAHPCVTGPQQDDRKARLDRMLKSGAITQEYYDNAIKEMSK